MRTTRRANIKTLDDIVDAITANFSNLVPNVEYTLEQLTGTDYWSTLTKGERTGLGIKFKSLAKKTGVPVVWVGSTSTHKQLYKIT